jgi:uncharacterized membrane protein YgcG
MTNFLLENQIIKLVEQSRKETELNLKSSNNKPEEVLKNFIDSNFKNINFFHDNSDTNSKKSSIVYIDEVILEKETIKPKSNRNKSILGSTLVVVGQPILKKRFVMAGSAAGTSIASKYLSTILPQKLPIRILGTTVLGRAIGRVVPYVGWALLAIDITEIIIEYSEHNQNSDKGFGGGFGGGQFSGGGAGGKW